MFRTTLILLLLLALLSPRAFSIFEDFDDQLDPDVWTLLGDAHLSNGYLVLTNNQAWQNGALYLNEQFSQIDEVHVSFDLIIRDNNVTGDGCAFAISNALELGSDGGDLGWEGPGIYGIEFDAYHNFFDPVDTHHIAVIESSVGNHLAYTTDIIFVGYVTYHVDIMIIDGQFSITVDDTQVINYQHPDYEPDQEVYLGLTAATGIQFDSYTFDNLEIHAGQEAVDVNLTSDIAILPPGGGTLEFDVHVVSNLPNTYPGVWFWTKIKLPNGTYLPQILYQLQFTLLPYMNVTGSLTQNIPFYAPAGDYELWGWVGVNPYSQIRVGDFFFFHKDGITGDVQVNDWATQGVFDVDQVAAVEETHPTIYEMQPVTPNPFNPTANVSIALPETAELKVAVFNVMGQQVAELANGQFNAGVQTFTIDGSALASGIYFVKATVPGQLDAIQKITLMK